MLEEEVDQALGCCSYERAEDRRGYRNGAETRRVTTSVGTRELRVPRARVRDEETGETTEFRSELLPRYARRTREVDEAILGTYLSGANSRRIRKALKPLLGEEHLSKSAVSRVVSRLKERFEEWQNRALSEEVYAIVYIQSWHQEQLSPIIFKVPKTRVWDEDTNQRSVDTRRQADVYVFALLAHTHQRTLDPLNVSQWEFFVVPTISLDHRIRSQHSIALPSLRALSGESVSFSKLKSAVEKAGKIQRTAIRRSRADDACGPE